jgi:hypothetical protein
MASSQHDPEKHISVDARDVGTSSDSNTEFNQDTTWETGWKARFPYLGVAALFCVWVAAGAAAVVLVFSDGKAQSTWPKKITPNVILAAINAFANIMLAVGIGQGVAIAWWRKVIRGATVTDLHHSWGFSTSLVSLVKGWKYLNFIALAALATKVAIIDSILLQRATQTYQANDPARLVSIIAPQVLSFPTTGVIPAGQNSVTYTDSLFQEEVVNYWKGGNLDSSATTAQFQGCNGACNGTLPSVGFSYSCEAVNASYFQYSSLEQVNLTEAQYQDGRSVPIFDVSFEMSWANATKNYTSIIFDSMYFTATSGTGDCSGTMGRMKCEIRPALLDSRFTLYDFDALISASNSGSTALMQLGWPLVSTTPGDLSSTSQALNAWNSVGNQLNTFDVKSFLPIAEDGSAGNTTMGGIQLVLQQYLGSSANITYNKTTETWDLQSTGTFGEQQLAAYEGYTPGTCNYMYSQGTGLNIVYAINDLGFTLTTNDYTNVDVTNTHNITVSEVSLGVHYRTNYGFMAAALACMVLCTLIVLPSYWGFWELGRQVSLAPVEIASAFMAPVLENPHAGRGVVADLLKEVGHRKVMFGELTEGRMAVEEIGKVRRVGSGPFWRSCSINILNA